MISTDCEQKGIATSVAWHMVRAAACHHWRIPGHGGVVKRVCPHPRGLWGMAISPVPLVHGQLGLGVSKPHETVLLLDTADVDQPAPVQLALHQRLVPAVGSVREQVLVPSLTLQVFPMWNNCSLSHKNKRQCTQAKSIMM